MTKTVALRSSTLAHKYHSLVFTFVKGGGVILKNCQRRLFQEDRVTRKKVQKTSQRMLRFLSEAEGHQKLPY